MNRTIKGTLLVMFFSAVLCTICRAQEVLPSKDEISKIEQRGRAIANYEKAAIRATDLLLASKPDESRLGAYLAVKKNDSWFVYFGKNSEKGFETQYIFSCPEGRFNEMKRLDQAEIEKDIGQTFSENLYEFAKAIDLAFKSITDAERKFTRYNTMFFEADGTITVYLTHLLRKTLYCSE